MVDRPLDLDVPVTKLLWDTARDRLVCLYGMWGTGRVRVVSGADGDLRGDGAAIEPTALTRLPWDGQVLDNGLVVVVGEEGILLCDLATGAVVDRWRVLSPEPGPAEDGNQRALCAIPDGSSVWCGGASGFLHRFDRRPDGSYAEAPPRALGEGIRALELLDDGSLLSGQCNGVLQRLLPDGTVVPFVGHRDDVFDVDWSRASGELCIASGDLAGSVRLWRGDGTLIREIRAHTNTVWSVRFSPQGDRLLTGSADGTARIWSVTLDLGK